MTLDIQQALNNIVIAVREYRGTWQQHQELDASLAVIQGQLNELAALKQEQHSELAGLKEKLNGLLALQPMEPEVAPPAHNDIVALKESLNGLLALQRAEPLAPEQP